MPRHLKPGSRPPVLIVEDSVDFSNLLKFIVEDVGYEGLQFPLGDADLPTPIYPYRNFLDMQGVRAIHDI